jgi:hypothetical protein
MQIKYMLAALCCASLVAGFAACGGDDDDDDDNDNGGGGACDRMCPTAVEMGCKDDVASCVQECEGLLTQLPAECADELEAFATCIEGASDLECNPLYVLAADSCEQESLTVFACAVPAGTGGSGGAAPASGGTNGDAGSAATDGGANGS